MPITVDDPELEAALQRLAERKGETPAQALRAAVVERDARNPALRRPLSDAERAERECRIDEILARLDSAPILDPRSPDEILGYDENGLTA